MAELRELTASDVAARLQVLHDHSVETIEPEVDETRWTYRESAALLGFFDAGSLRPSHGKRNDAALREFVGRDCERVATSAGHRWRLDPAVRQETLRRLAEPQRMLAAAAVVEPDPLDVGRAMAEAYLTDSAPALDRQTIDQLHGSLQAIEWLSPVGIKMPLAMSVRGRVALANLLQPLRTLVGDHFIGRERELDRLADYVEVLPAGSLPKGIVRRLRNVFRLSEKPPLVIHGPGGIGKSTLVARFVLQHADLGADRRFPFAYLSFDRADLIPQQPLTLLAESVHQLGAIYPMAAAQALAFEQSVRATLRSLSAADQERGRAARSSAPAVSGARADERDLLRRFGGLVESVIDRGEPLLWILDAFEQAQRHGPRAVERLWGFLDDLQSVFPRLRVVFAGRAPLDGKATDELPLQGFDDKLALAFLHEQLEDMKVSDRFLRSVAKQVDANPLSLKLAAELLRREGKRGLRGLAIFKLSAEEVQGVLYRRILDHLDDPDLRRIANPGLVVRRVTAEVIAEVLAVPCRLGRIGRDRAEQLFEMLKREASLVESVDKDTVVHRADVRRTMLPLLQRADPETVKSIHRRAIRYYRGLEGVQARTEELYHRLALGQSTSTLDERWDPVAGALLERALVELPAAGQVYLTDRLGLPGDPEMLAKADDEAWVRQAARIGRELLDAGRPQEALELVQERNSRSVHLAVMALRVEALAMLGQMDEALAAVDSGLALATQDGLSSTFVELALLGARIAEDKGLFDQALRLVEQARSVASATGDRIGGLSAGVAQLRLYRRSGSAGSPEARRLREEVIEESRDLRSGEWSRYPSLLRDLAAEIGDALPELIVDATRLVGVDIEGDAGRILDDVLTGEEKGLFISFTQQEASDVPSRETSGLPSVQRSLTGQTVTEQGRQVSEYLRQAPTDSPWNEALVQVYQDEVDKPSF